VAVIGGGNSAIDAARVAHRLGSEVTIVYRRTQKEMPAFEDEVENALKEGIKIHFLAAPTSVFTENNRISSIECIRMKLGTPDESGRRRPVPIQGSEFTIQIDTLIVAISEEPVTDFVSEKVRLTKWRTVEIEEGTLMTSQPGIFAAGDATRGPSTVIEAIRDGKIAAESIDAFLKCMPWQREYKITRPSLYIPPMALTQEEIDELKTVKMPELEPSDRQNNFKEVELGFSCDMASKEAKRCLRCEFETNEGREFLEALKRKTNG
jgi:NADPH-dependent glutamate synthase beta subunit-like oxidoreductase